MKRLLLFLVISLSALLPLRAQLPDGSIAPDFTLQDIDGTPRHLYEYLDSGKTVIIDFFEVMCRPCWDYHTTHSLAKAYNAWGPSGTNQLMILEIEGIKSTVDQIRGIGGSTYGNWTEGEPFPFIATCAPNTDQVTKDYKITFFPSIFMICRDRRTRLIGTADTATIHAKMLQCPGEPTDSLFIDLVAIDSVTKVGCRDSIHPWLKLQNYGIQPVAAMKLDLMVDNASPQNIDWSGILNTYDALELDGLNTTQLSDGSHNFSYVIKELNGVTSGFRKDTIKFRATVMKNWQALPFTENFESMDFPYNRWTIVNNYPSVPTWERADLGYAQALRIPYFNIDPNFKSSIFLPGVSLENVTNASLRFDLACVHNNSVIRNGGYDIIEVDYSLDCGKTNVLLANISEIENQTAPDDSNYFIPTDSQWKEISLNLSAATGKPNVIVSFQSNPAYGNNMYIKNLRIVNSTGTEDDPGNVHILIWPQPARETVSVRFSAVQENISMTLADSRGRIVKVFSIQNGMKNITLPVADLPPGCYFLRIVTSDLTTTKKIVIE